MPRLVLQIFVRDIVQRQCNVIDYAHKQYNNNIKDYVWNSKDSFLKELQPSQYVKLLYCLFALYVVLLKILICCFACTCSCGQSAWERRGTAGWRHARGRGHTMQQRKEEQEATRWNLVTEIRMHQNSSDGNMDWQSAYWDVSTFDLWNILKSHRGSFLITPREMAIKYLCCLYAL